MNLGAYYATKPLQAISGLGAAAPEQNLADVAVSTMQALLSAAKPLGTFVPWADQVGDVDWKVVSPDTRYALYPVTSDLLAATERAAFGQPVGFVTVFSTKPLLLSEAAALFNGTPYEYFSTDAVYRADDAKPAPTIYFVFWGRLRADAQTIGNYANLEKQANSAGAQLSFPVNMPVPAGVSQPQVDFNLAMRAQMMPAAAATTPLAPAAVTPSASLLPGAATAPQEPSTGIGTVLMVIAVGGVAAYAGYRIVKSRKKRAA
jgi:hypothetical protein